MLYDGGQLLCSCSVVSMSCLADMASLHFIRCSVLDFLVRSFLKAKCKALIECMD